MIFTPPLGLYIHIPWCLKKCPFCDLNTCKINFNNIKQKTYIKHLIKDLQENKFLIKNRIIKTIFIGGGTPNLLHHKLFKILINQIKNIISINTEIEFTIEIHPEFITIEEILEYISIGINRISLGVQSFNNKILQKIGRTNTEKKTMQIINQIKKYTKINFNIDLMYGLPYQTLEDSLCDLRKAICIQPNHISWYQLNIEKNTVFYYQKPSLPKNNIIWNMYFYGNKLLKNAQYKKYEISSYAKYQDVCHHNMNYWNFGDYFGIGCGAHSKITTQDKKIIRIIKKKRIYDYCNNIGHIEKIYTVQDKHKPFEYFMNAFRIFKVTKKNFFQYTNLNIKNIQKNIQLAILKKYIQENKKYWTILPKGKLFFNDLIELFL